jgi:HD superfamily phosphodiesterase
MLDEREALSLLESHLGRTAKAQHSRAVGLLLRKLAEVCHADPVVWTLTGICHDLDYHETRGDRSQHGVLAAQWLAGRLPREALEAIAAHDHRAGMTPASPLAKALKLADILVIRAERGLTTTASGTEGSGHRTRCTVDLHELVEHLLVELRVTLVAATEMAEKASQFGCSGGDGRGRDRSQ